MRTGTLQDNITVPEDNSFERRAATMLLVVFGSHMQVKLMHAVLAH